MASPSRNRRGSDGAGGRAVAAGWGRGRTRAVRPSVWWASPPGAGISPPFFLLLFFQYLFPFKNQPRSHPAGRWHFAFGSCWVKAERGERRGWVRHHPESARRSLARRETEAGHRAVSKLGKVTEKLAGGSRRAEASEQPVLWLTLPSCLY